MADRDFNRSGNFQYGRGKNRGPPSARPSDSGRKRSRSPGKGLHSESRGNKNTRYEIVTPNCSFSNKEISVHELKRRFGKMYIPSDFFHGDLLWNDCFPAHLPYSLGNFCDFHIFHKDVDYPSSLEILDDLSLLEPSDANYAYSAKVMLLSSKDLINIYDQTIRVADEDSSTIHDKRSWLKELHFLVGTKGKSEVMAIGGPWSPSLDGSDPASDPQVLVNTAIRTCKSQTGIDLSLCVRWFKFLELHYYRPAERVHVTKSSSGKRDDDEQEQEKQTESTIQPEARVETVVMFLPDIYNCMPSISEWKAQCNIYKDLHDHKINPTAPPPPVESTTMLLNGSNIENVEVNAETNQGEEGLNADQTQKDENKRMEPTHYSKLDITNLKVAQLRSELDARGIDSKGLKSQLMSKLESILKEEEEREKKAISGEQSKDADKKADELQGELSEKDRRRLERLYRLDENKPAIVVHPSRKARGGRFDCEKVPLGSLLDYRVDDQKEHTFEVSLFAEQFRDMIMRDCAFNIYKGLLSFNESVEEKDKSKEPASKRSKTCVKVPDDDLPKIRKIKRTVDSHLLFSFCVFDTAFAGYIKNTDMEKILFSLGLNLSRAQIRKLLHKGDSRKEVIDYRRLTDKEVSEGDPDDVTIMSSVISNKEELAETALGNRSLFEEVVKVGPKLYFCDGTDDELVEQYLQSEECRRHIHFIYGSLKNETERTEKLLQLTKESENRANAEAKKVADDLVDHRNRLKEFSEQNDIYLGLIKNARELTNSVHTSITHQFHLEKMAKDAEEKAKADAKKALEEPAVAETNETDTDKVDDKPDFEVVDTA